MKTTDDFLWSEYTKEYYNVQVDDMLSKDIDFVINKTFEKNKKIIWKENIHPFNKILYEKIVKLNPSSVFECGCAAGHHLYNIKKLLPDVKVGGCELLQSQVDTMSKVLNIPKSITDNISIFDFSSVNSMHIIGKNYDFVYTNAVTMHINYNSAVLFIRNMAKLSNKYIWLAEDVNQHNYTDIFKIHLHGWKVSTQESGYFLEKIK